jgi:diguanylate cyclase (GGDEF)-like protein
VSHSTSKSEVTTIIVPAQVYDKRDSLNKSPYLVVLDGCNLGQLYALKTPTLIGRSVGMDFSVSDHGVSNRHCELSFEDETWILRDLGSRNGTYVNGHRIQVQGLQEGDRISIGCSTVLKFTYLDEQEVIFSIKVAELIAQDSLTGAYSKRCLIPLIERELYYSKEYQKPFSLMMLDLDHFKNINDQFGHLAGDHVLIQFATEIKSQIRNQDWFIRYGGEEFIVIARGLGYNQGLILADRLRRSIENLNIVYKTQTIRLTASVGLASFPEDKVLSVAELISKVDHALYQAKAHGRNCVMLANENKQLFTLPD